MNTLALRFPRQFGSLQLSVLMLVALLQRTPVLRMLVSADSLWLRSSLGHVLRSSTMVASALGLVDTLAGATTFTTDPASPASATVGSPFAAAFALTGANGTVGSYTISGLPPGLAVPNSTASGSNRLLNNSTGTISGTPTTAGNYVVNITAWQFSNATGDSIPNTYTINVTGGGGGVVAPSISTHPAAQSVTAGQAASFSVTASGTEPFTYQWRKDGNNIGGATNSTYSIASTVTGDAGAYSVVVTNSAGSATSNNAALTVSAAATAPSISSHPSSQNVTAGQTASFSVTASGTAPLSYQWRKDGNNISGATASTFSIASVATGDAGTYSVVVTNSAGSATSNNATLTVTAAAVAPSITSHPADQRITAGQTASFSVTANGTAPLNYQWQKDGANIGGATAPTLSIMSAAEDNIGGYSVIVSNAAGSVISGTAYLSLSSGATKDFNGDNRSDVLWVNTVTGERAMWLMDGLTPVGGAVIGVVPVEWVISAAGDFNGDGKSDIFWTDTTTGDRAAWLMDGSNVVLNTYLSQVPVEWEVSGAGDFNGDGKDDIVWTNTATGDRAMWFMNGGSVIGGGYMTTVPLAWKVRGTGDSNGDGKADILWSNTGTGERAMWIMNGIELAGGAVIGVVPVEWEMSATGDYNGDGKADIVWTNTITGDRAMWLMDGTNMAQNAFLGTVPVEWKMSASGDYNGDGKADVFWTNTTTGDRAIWHIDGGVVIGGGFLTTLSLDWIVQK